MKQVININFHGQVVPIETTAFELLKGYTASLSRYFANEEGKDEIINDIESRIGELFQERLKKGSTCITEDDVNAIIKSMGRPEEFEGEEEKVANTLGEASGAKATGQQSQTGSSTFSGTGKTRMYRDENNKIIGGVCSGLANYFGTDSVVIRIIFLLVAFAGFGILAYIILWVTVPSSASTVIGASRKKLFRDPDDKIISGVCSGIGNYFGVSAWVPRIFFLLPFLSFVFHSWHWWGFDFPRFINLSFSPGSLIVYIILWLVIPEAGSTAEKLEMKGEKVDMNSIKNSVVEEMKGVQQRAEKFGQEAKTFATEKGQQMGAELKTVAKRSGTSLGDVIILIVKAFAYFVIGSVCFGLVIALFALAIVSMGLFPLKDFLLTEGWQNIFAWGTLVFFIAVPVIGIITWIIRRLAKMKSNRKILTASFISLWVLGWVCFICLMASISKDFKSINNVTEQDVMLSNAGVNKLELTTNSPLKNAYRYNSFRIEPFEGWDEDTVFVNNIAVNIIKSASDSFKVTVLKIASGRNKHYADTLAEKIQFNAIQRDTLLIVDKGIAITRNDKFRNQRVVINVYVPVGKRIRVDKSVGWGDNNVRFDGPWNVGNYNIERDDAEWGWDHNEDYIMKADGLYKLNGKKANANKDDEDKDDSKVKIGPSGIEVNDNGDKVKIDKSGIKITDAGKGDSYRYNADETARKKADSIKQSLDKEQLHLKDSLEKVKQNADKQIQKIEGKKETAALAYPATIFVPFIELD